MVCVNGRLDLLTRWHKISAKWRSPHVHTTKISEKEAKCQAVCLKRFTYGVASPSALAPKRTRNALLPLCLK